MTEQKNITSFDDLEFARAMDGGIHARVAFGNGYGASVIMSPYSYGGEAGLYELAVLHNGELCYDTPITDDVLGYLSTAEVSDLLVRISQLPAEAVR